MTGTWGSQLVLTAPPGVTKHRALADRIAADVEAGHLPPETRLPTHRELARMLGVSVQTVSLAYKEAERRGYLKGEVGRGTYVQDQRSKAADRGMLTLSAEEAGDLSIIRPVYTAQHDRAFREALARLGQQDSAPYMNACRPVTGLAAHREAGRAWLETLGVSVPAERVVLTNGAAQGVHVALASIVRPGDIVAADQLTDHGVIGLASLLGVRLRGLPSDDEGILPEAFARLCTAERVTALVVCPTLSNPTGKTMGAARRRDLAAIARRHEVYVIEDEVFKPLLEQELPAFTALLPDLGFFVTSFSKSVMPGLRAGYVVPPAHLLLRLTSVLRVTSWSGTSLTGEIATRWLQDGTIPALIRLQRQEIRARQASAREILDGHLRCAADLALCLWLALPEHWSEAALVAALAGNGISVTRSHAFQVGEVPQDGLRICLGGARSLPDTQALLTRLRQCLDQAPPL